MARRNTWDVEPNGGRWAVRREGATRADSVFDRQQDAIRRGVELGEKHHGQLRIKGEDGQIRDERTYTNDPYPPTG